MHVCAIKKDPVNAEKSSYLWIVDTFYVLAGILQTANQQPSHLKVSKAIEHSYCDINKFYCW